MFPIKLTDVNPLPARSTRVIGNGKSLSKQIEVRNIHSYARLCNLLTLMMLIWGIPDNYKGDDPNDK